MSAPSRAPAESEGTTILLVDDDSAFRAVYADLLRQRGYTVTEADDRPSAAAAFAAGDSGVGGSSARGFSARGFDVVLLDLMLPPDGTAEGGTRQLRELIATRPSTKVIVVSGAGDTRAMLDAVAAGAFDFLTKPADPDVLLTVVARAVHRTRLEEQLEDLRDSLLRENPDALIGDSAAFRAAVELAGRVAASDLPVLVVGENGTGKEVIARLVHRKSRRAGGPFVAVNCGAVPDTLFESMLFGHKKGAFTGAQRDHAGLFARADGGTLFLDEVAELSPQNQVKLLRALENGEILPVGASLPERVDVRILSATNRDLAAVMASGELREDLYWRIKGAEVALPPLRDRPGDVLLLARYFLNQAAALTPNGKPRQLAPSAEAALEAHRWPGNLRELRHEMQRATVLAGTRTTIEATDLGIGATPAPGGTAVSPLADKIGALERREIERALADHHGNRTRAAEALGLSRQGLLKKMQRYGLA